MMAKRHAPMMPPEMLEQWNQNCVHTASPISTVSSRMHVFAHGGHSKLKKGELTSGNFGNDHLNNRSILLLSFPKHHSLNTSPPLPLRELPLYTRDKVARNQAYILNHWLLAPFPMVLYRTGPTFWPELLSDDAADENRGHFCKNLKVRLSMFCASVCTFSDQSECVYGACRKNIKINGPSFNCSHKS